MAKKKKVNVRKLAQALGADSVTGPVQVDRRGREYFQLELIAKDGHQTKRVYRLFDDEVGKYKLITDTEGQFFTHCIFIGRHIENFCNRVYGYQILKPIHKGMEIRVIFYEKA